MKNQLTLLLTIASAQIVLILVLLIIGSQARIQVQDNRDKLKQINEMLIFQKHQLETIYKLKVKVRE